jgi:hypothetical protein
VERRLWRALLLGENGRGGAPPSASADDFPREWQHGTKRWMVLEVGIYL